MKKVVVLSGSGISAESGIKTFRDSDGLWNNHKIEEVCTYDAWLNNPDLVLEFYNQRRKQLGEVKPNKAHFSLVDLEKKFEVQIITQNVDDLHERAGSTNVLHLHGELKKARSTADENIVHELEHWELKKGDLCEKGSQLRPHIVWFGEAVPMMDVATQLCKTADILIICGTSLQVYPAAGLINYVRKGRLIYLIDPGDFNTAMYPPIEFVQEKASIGVPQVVNKILEEEL